MHFDAVVAGLDDPRFRNLEPHRAAAEHEDLVIRARAPAVPGHETRDRMLDALATRHGLFVLERLRQQEGLDGGDRAPSFVVRHRRSGAELQSRGDKDRVRCSQSVAGAHGGGIEQYFSSNRLQFQIREVTERGDAAERSPR